MVYINAKTCNEEYLEKWDGSIPVGIKLLDDFSLKKLIGEEVVSEGHVFVLRYIRIISKNIRNFGFLIMESINIKVFSRFWPSNKRGKIKNEVK